MRREKTQSFNIDREAKGSRGKFSLFSPGKGKVNSELSKEKRGGFLSSWH